MPRRLTRKTWPAAVLAAGVLLTSAATARAADPPAASPTSQNPITIGFGMALTGGLAPNGKAALLAMQIWQDNINAKGGLLGRTVKLVYYDDQSNPANIPGLYTKLLDVDKVDLVISGYGTNMVVPAIPIVMQQKRTFLGLLALDGNAEFNYANYFAIGPTGGPHPKQSFSKGFFEVAKTLDPPPKTIALVGADAEFPRNALEGAHQLASDAGLKVVYDRTYPPSTTDYSPIVRAIQATSPDLVFVASYPPDSVGILRAATEVGLQARLFGGGMVGLQATAIKTQMGPLLNGVVDYDFWLPIGPYATPEALAFLKQYQDKAAAPELIAWASTCPRSPTPTCRCCRPRSRASAASISRNSPITCARTPSTPSPATSPSVRTASGPKRASWRSSSST